MRVEQISNRQLLFIVLIMRTTVIIALLPVLTAADALQDAWASSILAFLGTALLVTMITGLGVRFPRQTIVEISRILLGKAGGALISLIILWSFLHMAAIETRVYSEMIIDTYLPDTPLFFIIAVMTLIAVAAAYNGIEVIGRAADMVIPLFLGSIIIGIGVSFIDADFINLQPVLARGFRPVLSGSIHPISFSTYLLVVGMLIPQLTVPRRAVRTVFWGIAVASVILILSSTLTVAVLGPEEGFRAVFPVFRAVRAVRMSEFLERMDPLITFYWGFGLFITFSTFIYCGARGTAQLFNMRDYRDIMLPMGVIWAVMSINIAENIFEFRTFYLREYLDYYFFFLLLFPYLILWGTYLVRKMLGQDLQGVKEDNG